MHISRNTLSATLLSLIVGLIGCTNPSMGNPPPPGVTSATLEVVGATARVVNEYAEEVVEVRYLDQNAQPVADATVEFGLLGNVAGASLSAAAATTDAQGVASITVRTGQSANYDLVASAPVSTDAVVIFDVRQMRFGNLTYRVSYPGARLVRTTEVALFSNTSCLALATRVPSPSAVQFGRLGQMEQFAEVEVGAPMAVYALGIDTRDNVAAELCVDVTLSEPTGHVDLVLADIREELGGRYNVEETFDVTAGLPEALDRTLDFFYGISTNPGLWIVDFVADQSDTPRWLRTALRWAPTRIAVANILNDAIDDVTVPGYIDDVVDVGADLDSALRAMTLVGDLSFPDADEFRVGRGQHRIHTMRVPVDGGFAELPVSAMARVDVTVGETIALPEHALTIPFGSLVQTLLNDVLLARLPGAPANLTELVASLIDCEAVAREAAPEDATMESIVNTVCRLGTTVLGGALEAEVLDLFNYDTLYLQGTAELHDTDGDYDRETIANGMSTARWVDSASMDMAAGLMFPGTMSGLLLDDTTGRPHVVREQMMSLR